MNKVDKTKKIFIRFIIMGCLAPTIAIISSIFIFYFIYPDTPVDIISSNQE